MITALCYVLPFGRFFIWPLLILSTFAHEMGHGFAALIVGAHFDSLQIFLNGASYELSKRNCTNDGYLGHNFNAVLTCGVRFTPPAVSQHPDMYRIL